jgi:hypothetical protein
MKQSTRRRAAALFLFVGTFFVAACGSSSNNTSFDQSQSTAALAGRYLATLPLTEGKTGTMDFTVNDVGQAAGFFSVDSQVLSQTLTISLPTGRYPIAGFVTADGQFVMSGDFPGIGPFSLTGFLPSLTTPGSFTLTVNGQTSTGTIPVRGTTPSPTATSTGTPTNSPSPSNTPAVNNLVATFEPGPNAPNFDTSPISVLSFWQTDFAANSLFANLQNGGEALQTSSVTPLRRIQVNIDGGTIAAGQSFNVGGANNPHGVIFATRTGAANFGFWTATAGTLRVTEVTGNIVTLVGEDLDFSPATGGIQGNAVGTFRLDFQSRFDKTMDKLL